jgi:uncharacterized protein
MKNNTGDRQKIANFAEWVIKRRWLVLLGTIVIAVVTGMGAMNLKFNNDYHIFFSDQNPHVLAFDGIQEKYTKDDNAVIVIAPENGKVFTREALSAIEDLEKSAWQTPYSTRVDALSNYQHTHSEGDDMYVENLASDAADMSDAELDRIKEIALNEPLIMNRLINEDASVTAINISVDIPVDSLNGPLEVGSFVRAMTEEWEEANPGYKTYLSGIVMMNMSFAEESQGDMMTLVPLMFLLILIVVVFTTRSLGGMITAFLVLACSLMVAMGTTGWLGIEMTGVLASAPTMIMTLAIADSIHLLLTMLQLMRSGKTKKEAIVESMRLNFMPVFLTSVTTIIGFLTLNFVEGQPFHDLGNITAVGVAAAFFFSIFLLPAVMAILPLRVKVISDAERPKKFVEKLADFVILHNRKILISSIVAVIGISALSVKNELNNEFVKFFDKSVKFRTDTDFISENLTGIYTIEYSLGSGESDGISDPKYLAKLDEFDTWLREQDEVMHVNTFSETMKRVNKSMHGDEQSYYTVPKAKNEAAQYLLLYEMSLPYGLDLNNQVNVDKSETRFTVTLKNITSQQMIALTERAEQWLRVNAPGPMFSLGSSPTLMFAHIAKTNMLGMLKSGFVALLLISLILVFIFKSTKYGIISIVPNLTPILVAFGIWGVMNGMVNMAVAVVFGMTLGIVVDDTIHLMSKYIRARREMKKSPEDALRYAFATVGRALIVNTIILAAGFSVLMQSAFGFNSDMGKMTAITIIVALILDLLLLPAILLAVDKDKTPKSIEVPQDRITEE